MKKNYIKMKNVESIIKSLYGEKDSHEEYLKIYKTLLNKKNVPEIIDFIGRIDEYITDEGYVDSYYRSLEAIEEHFPCITTCMDLFISYVKENQSVSLAYAILRYANGEEQIAIIDIILKSQDINGYNLYVSTSKGNFGFVLNRLIEMDDFKTAVDFVNYTGLVGDNFINYFIKKIGSDCFDITDELNYIVEIYSRSVGFRCQQMTDFIEKRYSGKDIYDYIIQTTFGNALINSFFKILLKEENIKYLISLIDEKSWFFEFDEADIDLIIATKNLDLYVKVYNTRNIYNIGSKDYSVKIFKALLESDNPEKVSSVINSQNQNFFHLDERGLYEEFLVRNKQGEEIINSFFMKYGLNYYKLLKAICTLGLIDDFFERLKTLDDEELLEQMRYFESMIPCLKELAENKTTKEDMLTYKYVIEIIDLLKSLIYSAGDGDENLDFYAECFEKEYDKAVQKEVTVPNRVEKIRKFFTKQN